MSHQSPRRKLIARSGQLLLADKAWPLFYLGIDLAYVFRDQTYRHDLNPAQHVDRKDGGRPARDDVAAHRTHDDVRSHDQSAECDQHAAYSYDSKWDDRE